MSLVPFPIHPYYLYCQLYFLSKCFNLQYLCHAVPRSHEENPFLPPAHLLKLDFGMESWIYVIKEFVRKFPEQLFENEEWVEAAVSVSWVLVK